MNQTIRHSFEAVSLLTTDKGKLTVTIIPAMNQPDWIIPSSLILSIEEQQQRIRTYSWQQQQVAVFHLLPHGRIFDKIIVLEGNTTTQRLALQTAGELRQAKLRISEVKDITLPKRYQRPLATDYASHQKSTATKAFEHTQNNLTDASTSLNQQRLNENEVSSYLYQMVVINETEYLIPDLDKIAQQLVGFDGLRDA